ncbi:MAG: hypothetical protein MUO85_03910 [candidate division Zixibacteria bacterium]|nr:hypothetical protein [candidate division Zixibacteria bacterium]
MKNKICTKCQKLKPVEEFHFRKSTKDGRQSYCKECVCETSRLWQRVNAKKVCESSRRWNRANTEKVCENHRRWRKTNPEKVHEYNRKATKKRRSTPQGKLNDSVGRSIRKSLQGNKNGRSWESLVNYGLEQLKRHIEKRFKPGMSWENYGEWEIDHIIPISAFNFEKPEDIDFKKCW